VLPHSFVFSSATNSAACYLNATETDGLTAEHAPASAGD